MMDPAKVEVIYAEDEETFRLITLRVLDQAGIPEEYIHVAENGLEAIDHFKRIQGSEPRPLLMILDVRMPHMDGETCAREVQKLVDRKQVSREPYVAILTSGVATTSEAEGEDKAVKMTMPKPLDLPRLRQILAAASTTWSRACAPMHCPRRPYDPGDIDIVVAMTEPTSSMALVATLSLLSVNDDYVNQADTREELIEHVSAAKDNDRPLLIFLGCAAWADLAELTPLLSKSYLAWVPAVEDCKDERIFDAVLSGASQFDARQLEPILQASHKKWYEG